MQEQLLFMRLNTFDRQRMSLPRKKKNEDLEDTFNDLADGHYAARFWALKR